MHQRIASARNDNEESEGFVCYFFLCDVIWENPVVEGQKEQALVSRRAFCAISDQSLDVLSHMNICRKHLSPILHNLKTV